MGSLGMFPWRWDGFCGAQRGLALTCLMDCDRTRDSVSTGVLVLEGGPRASPPLFFRIGGAYSIDSFAGVPEIKRRYLYSVLALLRAEEGTLIIHVCCFIGTGFDRKYHLHYNRIPFLKCHYPHISVGPRYLTVIPK